MLGYRELITELGRRLGALRRRGEAQRALGLAVLGVCVAAPARAQGSPPAGSEAESGGRLLVTVDAAEAEGAPDGPALLRGDVRVWALDPSAPESSQLVLRADEVQADLGAGWLRVPETLSLWSPRGTLVGHALDWDLGTREFTLHQGRGDVLLSLSRKRSAQPRLYFTGDEIKGLDQREVIEHATLTTCDREHPHYKLVASRVTVDRAAGKAVIRNASLDLYGFRVPLWPRFSTGFGGPKQDQLPLPWPGYSSRGGLSFPFQRTLTGAKSPVEVRGWLRLQQRAKPEPGLTARGTWGDVDYGLDWEMRRHTYSDLTSNNILLGTLPEVTAAGDWASSRPDAPRVTARLGVGRFRELAAGRVATVETDRMDLRGEWQWGEASREALDGWWGGLALRGSAYGDGHSYGVAAVTLGRGLALGSSAHLGLSYIHSLQAGHTPFFFDDTDIAREVRGELQTRVVGDWSVQAEGRYDVALGQLRDYTLRLTRDAHCLTWGLSYELAGRSVYVDLGFNGLNIPLGRYRQQPVVPRPDLPEPPQLVGAPRVLAAAPALSSVERAPRAPRQILEPVQPGPADMRPAAQPSAAPLAAPLEVPCDGAALGPANRPRAPDVPLDKPLVDELPPSLGIAPHMAGLRP